MADSKTIKAYDSKPELFIQEWLSQPFPQDLISIFSTYFHKEAPTVDIGCGSGRAVDWLNQNGYPCLGFDASAGLLVEARKNFPQYQFQQTFLPDLNEIKSEAFKNVVCETVIQHLAIEEVSLALKNLIRICAPQGVLYLSWRLPLNGNNRDAHSRLYTTLDPTSIISFIKAELQACILHNAKITSPSSGKVFQQLVIKK